MYSEGNSIPISISVTFSDVMEGIIEAEGLVRYAAQVVHLELKMGANWLGKSNSVSREIGLESLQSIEFKRRPVGSKIILEFKTLEKLSEIPGVEWNRLLLYVARKYRSQARDFVTLVEIHLRESRLSKL